MTFSSEEWSKCKLQTVRIWNPGKFLSCCTGLLKIPSAILVDCAVFRTLLDFTKKWTRWNFESIFLKIVHQKGLFDVIKENPNFPTRRRILHIYRQWLLISRMGSPLRYQDWYNKLETRLSVNSAERRIRKPPWQVFHLSIRWH